MNKKILFCSGEGLGNILQTIPVIRTLKEVLGYDIDFWWAFSSYLSREKLIPYVDKWIIGNGIRDINTSDYDGIVSTWWTRNHIKSFGLGDMELLNEIKPITMDRSEIDIYMQIARDLGVQEEDLIWHGVCNYNKVEPKYDIVIHNGYNRHSSADWSIKSYPYYKRLVELLGDFKVCSIGLKDEYIKGTYDETEVGLLSTLGIIKNSKFYIGNDSGLFHAANALETDNIAIFTATSIKKNYDERFHKHTTIVGRDDLKCRPCQAGRRWLKDCKNWKCKNINPWIISNMVERKLIYGDK